jgi:molybdopterin-containing oxidoreductase family membrane subunit
MNATQKQTQKSFVQPIWLGLTGLLTVAGIASWIYQLSKGLGVTQLNILNPWGIYIAGFVYFMGLSAGALILSALPVLFDLPTLRPYAKTTAFVALVALVIGGLFILIDLGNPDRLWRIVRYAHFGSPLLWDMLLTVVYLILSTVYLRRLMINDTPNAGLKTLAVLALLAGVGDGLNGMVFATQISREFWYSAVQPAAFVIAGVASAGAVLLLLAALLNTGLKAKDLNGLSILTGAALAVDLLLIASEVITLAFTRSTASTALVGDLLGSPLFWIEILAGLAAALLLLLPAARGQAFNRVAAALLALGELALKRYIFIEMGFAEPNIQLPGLPLAPAGAYIPNVYEWGVVIGLLALFGLLLSVGIHSLRLGANEKR